MQPEEQILVTQPQLVSWPSPQDYNEAVQTPEYTFADEDLKAAQPELNSLGLPRPSTGNFASVYKLQSAERNWALRCFLHQVSDQSAKYQLIHDALNQMRSKSFVDFAYLTNGILFGDRWYPVLKMVWADGEPLHEFIAHNLDNSAELLRVAQSIQQLNAELNSHGIAHGDLQHGNILVSRDAVLVVDYDAIYIPALEGQASPELGHRNYQHPNRGAHDFNDRLDNFSAWVIYVSLICIAEDPSLWHRLDGGDDCLLFRQIDFLNPIKSRAFQICEKHENERIRIHTRFLRNLLSYDLDQIPRLDEAVNDPPNLQPLTNQYQNDQAGPVQTPNWRPAVSFCFFLALGLVANMMLSMNSAKVVQPPTPEAATKISGSSIAAIDAQESGNGRYAIDLYQRSINELSKAPDKNLAEIAECWHQIAHCQHRLGNRQEALVSLAKAKQIYQQAADSIGLQNVEADQVVQLASPEDMNSPHHRIGDYHWPR